MLVNDIDEFGALWDITRYWSGWEEVPHYNELEMGDLVLCYWFDSPRDDRILGWLGEVTSRSGHALACDPCKVKSGIVSQGRYQEEGRLFKSFDHEIQLHKRVLRMKKVFLGNVLVWRGTVPCPFKHLSKPLMRVVYKKWLRSLD